MSQNDTLLRNLTLLRIIPRAPLRRDTNTLHEMLKEEGLKRGFKSVVSGPLVRSSYHAHEHVPQALEDK